MAPTRSARRWALTPTPGALRGQGMTMFHLIVLWARGRAGHPGSDRSGGGGGNEATTMHLPVSRRLNAEGLTQAASLPASGCPVDQMQERARDRARAGAKLAERPAAGVGDLEKGGASPAPIRLA